jgi:hypothetical protein
VNLIKQTPVISPDTIVHQQIRKICFLIFVLFGQNSIAQDRPLHFMESMTISYEQKYFQNDFQSQLKSIYGRIPEFKKPCQYISVGYLGELETARGYDHTGFFTFNFLLPQPILVNDSVKQKIKGFHLTFTLAGLSLVATDHFGMMICGGAKAGRVKLKDEQGVKMKNELVSPFAALYFKGTISIISIFAGAQYEYDVSSTRWKKTWFSKSSATSIPGFRQSGITLTAGISYNLK